MSDYRIVYNEETERYRVEKRGLTGWHFLMNKQGDDYATFVEYEDARCFACRHRSKRSLIPRRWRILDMCTRRCNA